VNGSAMRFDYNELGRVVASVQKNGGRVTTEYDAAGNIAAETDVLGAKTTYEYNANGLAIKVTDALGQSATMSYDALGNITKITSPDGSTVLYEYKPSGRAKSMTDETGAKTTYRYDEVGNIVAETTNDATTTYAYDKDGNITSVTDAEGREVKFTYDKAGNLTRTTYPDGTCSMTEYDVMGRVVKELPRSGAATEYQYDEAGNVTAITNGKRTTSYEYDILGRLVKTTYPDGSTAAYEYDALGNLVTETDALGNSTQYEYDKESLLKAVTYANSTKLSMTYDKAGNILSETDAAGGKTTYTYDKLGRMTNVTDALGSKTAYEYDVNDNLKKVKDANGHITEYEYDAKGNMTSETDALGNTVTYDYTPEGWLKQITKADGKVISFDYDKTGNIISEDYAGEITTENTYNELGKLTVTKSEEGETKYQYDGHGYLISVTNPNGDVVQYTYDQYGRKESLKYPDGRVVKYAYDGMDRLTKVTGLDGRDTQYEYNALGQRIKTSDGTLTTEYSYDNVGNLVKQATTGKTDIAFEYSYNSNNYITAEMRTESEKTVQSDYTYDARGQLTAFSKSDGYSESYSYDPAGNMMKKSIGGVDISMTYNAANQLKSMESTKGKIDYSYDQNGNLASKAMGEKTDTYSYDAMDQLTAYKGYDGYQQRYTYNAQGMMSAKESKGNSSRYTLEEIVSGKAMPSDEDDDPDPADEWVKTSYIYDITMPYYEVLTEETDGVTKAYDYGIERISAITSDFWYNVKTAYVYDGRGSVAQEVSNDISWYTIQTPLSPVFNISKSYTPFGEMLGYKTSGYGYKGEYYDAATGMVNLRARQYEPAMNRFSQKDILKGNAYSSLSLNRYLYVQNDPVNFVDPSGMFLDGIWNGIKKVAKKAWNGVASAAKWVYKAGQDTKKWIAQANTDSANWVKKEAKRSWDALGRDWESLKAGVNDFLTENSKRWEKFKKNPFSMNTPHLISFGLISDADQTTENLKTFLKPAYSLDDYLDIDRLNAGAKLASDIGMVYGGAKAITSGLGAATSALNGGGTSTAPGRIKIMTDENGRFYCTADDALESVTYSPVKPGPLKPSVAETFNGAVYKETVLTEETTFYRVYGGNSGKVGSYMTRVPQNGGTQSQIDLALNPEWGNTAQYTTNVTVPKGTVIYEGTAASQTINGGAGQLIGGGNQVYIPEVKASWFN